MRERKAKVEEGEREEGELGPVDIPQLAVHCRGGEPAARGPHAARLFFDWRNTAL